VVSGENAFMSEPQDETSPTENPGVEPAQEPPAATAPREGALVDELEERDRDDRLEAPRGHRSV
jgi:hypothetical protein